ncbi:MAG: hypothetical protein V2A73_02895, partial [Pseudomonadota bacterium]
MTACALVAVGLTLFGAGQTAGQTSLAFFRQNASTAPDSTQSNQLRLRVRRLPFAATLAMRPASQHPASGTENRGAALAPAAHSRQPNNQLRSGEYREQEAEKTRFSPIPLDVADLSRRVIFYVRFGYGMDEGDVAIQAAAPTTGTAAGAMAETGAEDGTRSMLAGYRATRILGFGDMAVGTKGVLIPSLSTYLSARFFGDSAGRATYSSVPTVFDATTEGRAALAYLAYGEIVGLKQRVLQPFRLRAGRQVRYYGLYPAHFDGALLAYETDVVCASAYLGQRVSLFGPDSRYFTTVKTQDSVGLLGGAAARFQTAVFAMPLRVSADFIGLEGERYVQAAVTLTPSPNTSIAATGRSHDDRLAFWQATARAHLQEIGVFSAQVDHRLEADWGYDMSPIGSQQAAEWSGRFLNLGKLPPSLRITTTASLAPYSSWDLILRGVGAWSESTSEAKLFSPTYFEINGGTELRLRYGLSIGVDGVSRRYHDDDTSVLLPGIGEVGGHRSLYGAAARVRHALGRRSLMGQIEAFFQSHSITTPRYPNGASDT